MSVCASCGARPVGTFNDGSPRFTCHLREPELHVPRVTPLYTDGESFDRVVVVLEADELAEADECARLRLTRAKRRKARDQLGEDSLASHATGAAGERAFSKWIGARWECTTGRYGGASDVRGVQIRTSTSTTKRLVVHETDPARTPVVSIVEHRPRYWLRGWIMAGDCKRPEWIADPGDRRPAFFVPTQELLPMQAFMGDNRARAAMQLPPKE